MDIQTLVNELSIIYDIYYNTDINIISLYRKISPLKISIRKHLSEDLYKEWVKIIEDIEYEIIFGNNDIYTNDATINCLKTLKIIINELINIEDNS